LGRADKDENWYSIDARTGEKIYTGPAPENLFQTAETKEEAIVMIAKLSMRPNDTWKGRSGKLSHYVDLHKRLYGILPQDLDKFIRTKADIPMTLKEEFTQILDANDWKEKIIPDPTMLPRMVRKTKE
jgi:acetyl-CoA decarbonylase/synthase complex subunit alpha